MRAGARRRRRPLDWPERGRCVRVTARCRSMSSSAKLRLAVYPGSFDPLTNGHIDIITRGASIFDRIIVAILVNLEKQPLFTERERVEIGREVFSSMPNVEVDTFEGLLVDYAR